MRRTLTVLALFGFVHVPASAAPQKPKTPNILFIMMDDVGIDQLHVFNPLAPIHPVTPVLDQIAAKGVKFTKFHTMPECSPSRTAFFTGRSAASRERHSSSATTLRPQPAMS